MTARGICTSSTPGIYSPAHVAGWKKVSAAVHDKGGRIFIQVMHAGRMSHPDNTPASSSGRGTLAIAADGQMFTATGMQDMPGAARAGRPRKCAGPSPDFRHAARSAIEAGADGVEIHGANGYLVQQFFAPNANTRTDDMAARSRTVPRFALEVRHRGCRRNRRGQDRHPPVARHSHGGHRRRRGRPGASNRYLVAELDKLGLAYLHVLHAGNEQLVGDIRALWTQPLIVNRPGRPRRPDRR